MKLKRLIFPTMLIGYFVLRNTPYVGILEFFRGGLFAFEVAMLFYLSLQAWRFLRSTASQSSPYLLDAVDSALVSTFGGGKYIKFIITELMVIYYIFFSWAKGSWTEKRAQGKLFHYRQGSQHHISLFFLLFVSSVEIPVMHLLFSLWDHTVAWIITGLAVYSLLWLLADYIASGHQPILLEDDVLMLRIGLWWKADVPLELIENVEKYTSKDNGTKLTMGLKKNTTVRLKREIELEGLIGMRKMSDSLVLGLDQPISFQRTILEQRDKSHEGSGTSGTSAMIEAPLP